MAQNIQLLQSIAIMPTLPDVTILETVSCDDNTLTGEIAGFIKALSGEKITKTYYENLFLMAVAMHLDKSTNRKNIVYRKSKTKAGVKGKFLGIICSAGYVLVPRCEIQLFKDLRMWSLCSPVMKPDCVVFFCPEACNTKLTKKKAYKLLSQTKRAGIPLLYIEEQSSTIIQTAHCCALRVVEHQRLLRALDIESGELFGFAFPRQQEPQNVEVMRIDDIEDFDCGVISDQEDDEDTDVQECFEDGSLNESSTIQPPQKKRRLNSTATAPIKVSVKWVTSRMRFDIKYEVLNENVWDTVTKVVTDARKMLIKKDLSSSHLKLAFFLIKLTQHEISDIKQIFSSFKHEEKWSWLKDKKDLEVSQLPSAPSFVFQVKSQSQSKSCIVKFFVNALACNSFRAANDVLNSLTDADKQYFCTLDYVMPFPQQPFFVFEELLPPLLTNDAKSCIVDLSKKVRAALQIMHSHDIAHLDVRLPNICYRRTTDNSYVPVLIDYERVRDCRLFCAGPYVKSDLYPTGLMNKYTDYVQLFRMAFSVVSNPPTGEHLTFVTSFISTAKSSDTDEFLDSEFDKFIEKLVQENCSHDEVAAVVGKRSAVSTT